jgi:PAS domain S-box-containing protein
MPADLEDLKMMWLELRAHVELLASERQQYLDIFERSTEAYLLTDGHGTIQDVNGAATDVLQRRRRHLHGKPLAALVALERRAAFRRHLAGLAAGGEPACRTVLEAAGERVDATLTARPIEEGGECRRICWLVRPAA